MENVDVTGLEQKIIHDLKSRIDVFLDFPESGVQFLDTFSLLNSPDVAEMVYNMMDKLFEPESYDMIVAPESRGFGFGQVMARAQKKGFLPARKPGKLPGETIGIDYELEYGSTRLEMHSGVLSAGTRVLIVDDLMATGGTARALVDLLENQLMCTVVGVATLISLDYLDRVDFPDGCELRSVMHYDEPPLTETE